MTPQEPTCGIVVIRLGPWVPIAGSNPVYVTFSGCVLSHRRELVSLSLEQRLLLGDTLQFAL